MDCMKVNSPVNVYEVFYPLNCVLKCCGLSSFSFVGPVRDGRVVTRPFNVLLIFLILCCHFILLALLFFRSFVNIKNSVVLNQAQYASVFGLVLMIIVTTIYQFFKRETIKEILVGLHDFDLETGITNKSINFMKHRREIFKWMGICVFMLGMMFTLYMNSYKFTDLNADTTRDLYGLLYGNIAVLIFMQPTLAFMSLKTRYRIIRECFE